MTGTQRFTWGLILDISGVLLLMVGILLTTTLCGAIVGIPMILVALPLIVWGVVWMFRAQNQKAQEAIASGIQEGMQRANQPGPPSLPTPAAQWSGAGEAGAVAGAEYQPERAPGDSNT